MCGIVGIVDTRVEPDIGVVRRMRDTLTHRGPDDAGDYGDEHAALGQRRLAIIDLASGRQPMSNEDGSIWIVFNGEIYNYKDLRAELERAGHEFRTNSDTETIVHAYEEWGAGCVERLRGMFAFAIWNTKTKSVLLARDRLGKKPLYWAQRGSQLLFASELKALLVHPNVGRDVDDRAILEYLDFGYVPAPRTPYRGIYKLAPAEYLQFKDGVATTTRYWDFTVCRDEPELDEEQLLTELQRRLEDCVKIRLISDVPLGAFLSGGIDSSLIVALMARASSRPVKTFTIGFREEAFNELRYARAVADHLQTEHHELVVDPDIAELVTELTAHFDEPFADSSMIPTYLVAKLASSSVKVVLSGDGGDEVFAGYDRYVNMQRARRFDRIPGFRALAAGASRFACPGLRRKLEVLATVPAQRELALRLMFPAHIRERLLDEEFSAVPVNGVSLPRRLYSRGSSSINEWLYDDTLTYLPEDILVKVDRATMAASLEARAPLLDHTLVEFMASVPSWIKVKNNSPKYLLKRIAERLVPHDVVHRKKMGFSIPAASWFSGRLAPFVEHKLRSIALRRWVRADTIEQILSEHRAGAYDHSAGIYTLLALALWLEHQAVAP